MSSPAPVPPSQPRPRTTAGGLPARVLRGYGMGSVATGSFGTVPGLLLLPYLTDRLGIGAGLAGIIVFAPKAWDVLVNPVAGRLSDNSTHPDGRRRPFLIRAGLALAVLFALIFAGPTAPAALGAAWVALAFLLAATAYAFFQVPYVSMPAELTESYEERTRLMTWRVVILAIAILVSGGLSPAIRDALGPEWGYRAVGVFVGLLIALGAIGAYRGTAGVRLAESTSATGSFGDQLRLVSTDRDFRALVTTFALQALATGAMLAGVDYVARTYFDGSGSATLLFIAFVAPAVLVTPLWERVGGRVGKRTAFVIASVLLALGAGLVFLVARSGLVPAAACLVLVGVGYAGAQMFPMAMLPDTAALDAHRSGHNRIGLYTGVWTAIETLGLACGPGLYAAVLAMGGYRSSTDGSAVQTAGAEQAILLGFTLAPASIVLVSLIPLLRYRIDEAAVRAAALDSREG
ncbi:MFS transporter [Actinomycetota bacterium]